MIISPIAAYYDRLLHEQNYRRTFMVSFTVLDKVMNEVIIFESNFAILEAGTIFLRLMGQ